jgi:serine/threonine protein kinase
MSSKPDLAPLEIPGYQFLEKIGQGSMGTVFKARQLSLNRLVAIKTLTPRFAAKTGLLKRLKEEAVIAAKLCHNNIVQAFEVIEAGDSFFFVMEYVEGTTIKEELERGKIYEEREAVEIILQMARAIQHASRRGLIHRDIKPANIILTAEGVAKLADLGMARETADVARARAEKGMTIGTPFYIAPEQIPGTKQIDVRADIYSLGATLYHMVTGQPPFPGTDVKSVLKAHLDQELVPPDHLNTKLSSGLGEVVEFMMAKDRRKRYRTPEDVIIDLDCLLRDEQPKLARHQIEATTLETLTEGEAEEEYRADVSGRIHWAWAAVLGCLLGVSVLFNIVLLIRRS